jgi:hypothetical protein
MVSKQIAADVPRPPTLDGAFSAVPDNKMAFVVDPRAQARAQYAAEMRWLAANPIDKAKRPGGYYLNADGSGAHDAEGRPVPLLPEDEVTATEMRARAEARAFALRPAGPGDSPEEIVDADRRAREAAREAATAVAMDQTARRS